MKIIPIKSLKNTSEISKTCHDSDEPIYVTKNGYGDMVIMSLEVYEDLIKNIEAFEEDKTNLSSETIESIKRRYGLKDN